MSLLEYRRYTAKCLANSFLKYDELNLKKLSAIRDPDKYISEVRRSIEESELTLQSDNQFNITAPGGGWDSESLRQEVRGKLEMNDGKDFSGDKNKFKNNIPF